MGSGGPVASRDGSAELQVTGRAELAGTGVPSCRPGPGRRPDGGRPPDGGRAGWERGHGADMSTLVGIEVRTLALSLRRPVGTSAGSHRRRPLVVVRVSTGAGEGWGECAAMEAGTAVDPAVGAVRRWLRAHGVPRLVTAAGWRDGEVPAAAAVAGLFGDTPVDRMGAAALEMAVLDAELRAAGISLAGRLGATRSVVPVGALAGIPEDRSVAAVVAEVDRLVARGYRRVRLKIAPGFDVEPVRAVRAAHPDLVLQADANGAYRWPGTGAEAGARLAAARRVRAGLLEQPLPPADLPSHAELADLLATPVALDESLRSPRRITEALRYGALEVACLKPGRLGGLFAARRALAQCAGAGSRRSWAASSRPGSAARPMPAWPPSTASHSPGTCRPPPSTWWRTRSATPNPAGASSRCRRGPGSASPDPAALDLVTENRELLPAPGEAGGPGRADWSRWSFAAAELPGGRRIGAPCNASSWNGGSADIHARLVRARQELVGAGRAAGGGGRGGRGRPPALTGLGDPAGHPRVRRGAPARRRHGAGPRRPGGRRGGPPAAPGRAARARR